MTQSFSSIHSAYSDSSVNIPLKNAEHSSKNFSHTNTSLSSSLHFHRKRIPYHRYHGGLPSVIRDRRNSFNKSDQSTMQQSLQYEQEQKASLIRSTEAILNEHLIMINDLLSTYRDSMNLSYSFYNSSINNCHYECLKELSLKNPMKERCSKTDTKTFVDLINNFQMDRESYYNFLVDSLRELIVTNNQALYCLNKPWDEDIVHGMLFFLKFYCIE